MICKLILFQAVVRCLTGHARGGGTFGCYCVRNGGGGDTKNFFRKVDSFWRSPPLLPKRQNYQLFEKIFRVPPVANTVTPKCPPPRCVPSKTQFWYFS